MTKLSSPRLISRRIAMRIGIGSIAALAVLSLAKLKGSKSALYALTNSDRLKKLQQRSFKVVDRRPLKDLAKTKGIIYGAFADTDHHQFAANRAFQELMIRQCNMTVMGVYWDQIRPSIDTFNFERPDYFAKFAAKNKLLIRAHPLVWYSAKPDWAKEQINRQNARKILTTHIQTVVKRYAGKMHSWDVVNEAIEPKDGRADGLRNDDWLKFLGADYIEFAFRTVARYDPNAMLVYNETGLEYEETNQKATLKLLERLKSKGVPIHALGIQSHLRGDREDFNPQKFRKFIREVANLGLKVMITELDVIDKYLPADIDQRDRIIAATYEDYLNAALAEKAVFAVINWGLTDLHTWMNGMLPREDGIASRPLPFDRNMQPKLAWNAIARAFDRAPKRPPFKHSISRSKPSRR